MKAININKKLIRELYEKEVFDLKAMQEEELAKKSINKLYRII